MSDNIRRGVKRVALKLYTRDLSLASGDVNYTGVGFKPSKIACLIFGSFPAVAQWGYYDNTPSYVCHCYNVQASAWTQDTDKLIRQDSASEALQTAVVKTLNQDGFTLTWTKTNLPTGTVYFMVWCFE